ncbi:hypothetical protein DNL40_02515 [Xylanimonas oleitrophica]|uniref:Uncharacterized protein n=1 Tax=Xylanimonas oleitrophica TaxID=2607479 RepID=A0A2W5WX65_9MICO|nr:hypothetical protein [Xylanimonas oleitrophica]PZR55263.1 hypothetical protein DNL40_02515 [Xylanimonas oleitrophica]
MTTVRAATYLGAPQYLVDTEHTCHGRGCTRQLVLDRRVRLNDGTYRLEGLRHDGTAIHVYIDRTETPA